MRPSHFLGRAILAWCVVGVCSAQTLPFPGSVATRAVAESFLIGFQLAVHKGREQGKVSEKVDSCVAKLDATADRFRHTSAGTKLMDPRTMEPVTQPPGMRERVLEVVSSCGK